MLVLSLDMYSIQQGVMVCSVVIKVRIPVLFWQVSHVFTSEHAHARILFRSFQRLQLYSLLLFHLCFDWQRLEGKCPISQFLSELTWTFS